MSFLYFPPKLNGRPHKVFTRVYKVPPEELLKRFPYKQASVISELLGEGLKSSDIEFTTWGEVKRGVSYDYIRKNIELCPIVTEMYEAQFDECNNIIHSCFESKKERIKDYKTKEKEIMTQKNEHQYSNEYDCSGKLVCKTDNKTLITLLNEKEQYNQSFKIVDSFDENGKLIKEEFDDISVILFSYNGELTISKKKYYNYNPFEQVKKYDFEYEKKYVYDAKNNLIKIVRENADGTVELLEEREYNKDGKLKCKTIKTYDRVSRIKYYNNKRIHISKGEWNNKQKYVIYTIEQLDEYGNVVEYYYRNKSKKYEPEKKIWVTEKPRVSKRTIKYTYDSYGNWTRMDYCIDGKNTNFVIREIEYYE